MIKMNSMEYLQTKFAQMVPILYVLSEDEHRTILGIRDLTQKGTSRFSTEVFVYKSTYGIVSIGDYEKEINDKRAEINTTTSDPNNAMIQIHRSSKKDRRQVYIMTDADRLLDDDQIVRRMKDFAVQADNSDSNLKIIVLLSSKLFLPDKLEKYVDVVTYPYPNDEEIKIIINDWVGKFNTAVKKLSRKIEIRTDFEIVNALKGLIVPQIHQAITACIDVTKREGKAKLDPIVLNRLKREAINKTSFLKFREPKVSFDDVGGLGRLKAWFRKMYGGWTNEGRKFGLPLLKGALLLGLPGCGKTRICEALAAEWQLNLLQFDPSRVFSSRVGESEGNMHLTLARIESMAPCILFIDEVEKGFAGMQSSSMSDAGTTARTISIFLIWMNDNESSVFNVSTCNQVHFLPPELISRYDEIFYIGPPDVQERAEIIDIQIRENGRDAKLFDTDKLARVCSHLSGREIMQAVREGMYEAFHARQTDPTIDLNNDILSGVLKRKIPVVKTMQKQLEYLVKWVGYDKDRRDGVRARFGNNDVDEIDTMFSEILENTDSDSSDSPQLPPTF